MSERQCKDGKAAAVCPEPNMLLGVVGQIGECRQRLLLQRMLRLEVIDGREATHLGQGEIAEMLARAVVKEPPLRYPARQAGDE